MQRWVHSVHDKRELLTPLPGETAKQFVTRSCEFYREDPQPVLSTCAKLLFGGTPPLEAAVEAMWVHGIHDTREDMKMPGKQRERIFCEVEEFEKHGDGRKPIMCVMVTCTKCGHQTESYGTHERSVRRCMALMAQECPNYESNYYHTEREDDGENYL